MEDGKVVRPRLDRGSHRMTMMMAGMMFMETATSEIYTSTTHDAQAIMLEDWTTDVGLRGNVGRQGSTAKVGPGKPYNDDDDGGDDADDDAGEANDRKYDVPDADDNAGGLDHRRGVERECRTARFYGQGWTGKTI